MTIEQRLTRLEKQNRRWRWTAAALAVTLAAGVLIGQGREEPIKREMTLDKLNIMDGNSTSRIVLEGDSLFFYDGNGELRAAIGTTDKGAAQFALRDGKGRTRVLMGVGDDAGAAINVYDRQRTARIALGTDGRGTAGLRHYDNQQRLRVSTSTDADGNATTVYVNDKLETVKTLP